jgi:hypothetical protein
MKRLFLLATLLCGITSYSYAQNNPTGYLDYVDQNGGFGWAYDADGGTQPIYVKIYIDGRFHTQVLANLNRPDLVSAHVAPNAEHGYNFTISGYDLTRAHEVTVYAVNYGGGASVQLMQSPATIGTKPNGTRSISAAAGGSTIVIGTHDFYAGAITSLTWWGQQFVDAHDHGREMQSALSYDGYGECYNPTEAGSVVNGASSQTSSYLQYMNASGNYLETQTLPAFWVEPGQTSYTYCGPNDPSNIAINTTKRSPDYFRKKVTIGMPGMQHVIKYITEFEITQNHTHAVIEAVTGYMPVAFSSFYSYNPQTQALAALSVDNNNAEQNLPVILSMPDGSHAMGIYAPDLPDDLWPTIGYARYKFGDCVKWNCVFRKNNLTAGTYKFQSYVMVGTLDNVKVSMNQLYGYLKPTANFIANTVNVGTPTTFTNTSTGVNSETKYQWDINNDGSVDFTTQNCSFTFPYYGSYQVKLTVINGRSADHRSSVIKTVAVNCPYAHPYMCESGPAGCLGCRAYAAADPTNKLGGLVMYPVPASKELTIASGQNETSIQFEIFNAQGQSVLQDKFIEKIDINTADFPAGIYIVRLTDGTQVENKKLIIEK